MKLNKILSSALVLVMLFASIVAVFPVSAFAAENNSGVTVDLSTIPEETPTSDEVKAIVEASLNYNYRSAEDMLKDELSKGYLVNASAGDYTVYVNYYTGFVYYKNNVTGQILTSNPIDPAYQVTDAASKLPLMSQIELTFSQKGNAGKETTYNSLNWIRDGAFLEVSKVDGKGISVKYTLGDISEFFIAPGVLLSENYKNDLCKPIFDNLAALMEKNCGPFSETVAAEVSSGRLKLLSYNIGDHESIKYSGGLSDGEYDVPTISRLISLINSYATEVIGDLNSPLLKEIKNYTSAVSIVFTDNAYSLIDASNRDYIAENIKNEVSAIGEGKAVYKIKNPTVDILRVIDKAIRTGCPDYTKELADQHELDCGYNPEALATPFINVNVRYFLDENGILTIDIPTDPSNLVFDAQLFEITSVTPHKYFGAGDMNRDGYIFYPDGSGTVVEFSDFYYGSNSDKTNASIYVNSPVYGNDYVYSEIKGAHREQVTMPVYGMVNDVYLGTSDTGYTTVTNGFFTIIEGGSSTASLCFESGGGRNKFAAAYSVIKPYPSDKYDLSQSLSVSGLGFYYVVAEKGYEGSCQYRINMLTDEDNAVLADPASAGKYYPADYTGMAACYRDYLEKNGTLSPIADVTEDIPLYIEALGSMDIIKRILTFPITVSTSLTTFEQVEKIYQDLSDITEAKKAFEAKAEDYAKKAKEIEKNNLVLNDDDKRLIGIYEDKAKHYKELAGKIESITNVNFRLTGFANGGMYFTYPAKVKWESSVGGKKGFKNLIAFAEENNNAANKNIGIFPDFDFLFINNTSAFDGVTNSSAARMVDNRYASKQSYDSVKQKYESLFALVISTDSLDKLYTKFEKKYSKYDIKTLSVSTLGSILNSNFDEDNIINRETALGHVTSLLDRMANEDGYSLMTDAGNMYSVKYVDHILNASIDSSHFRYSSFTVPFYGMVLHGYVNYAGAPLNYTGAPDYDILRSIENGASLYYILCYENTNHLKDDELLSQYYGIDYANWHENILENYLTVNNAIGDLQKYIIVDHEVLVCERVIDDDEMRANYQRLVDEYLNEIHRSVEDCIDAAAIANPNNRYGYQLKIEEESVKEAVSDILSTYANKEIAEEIKEAAIDKIDGILARVKERFPDKENAVTVSIDKNSILSNYVSQYSYVTDSVTNDENYMYTDFTCDNGSVVMVVYEDKASGDRVVFLLNYNNFKVDIRVDNSIDEALEDGNNKVYSLDEYGCYKLTSTGSVKIK